MDGSGIVEFAAFIVFIIVVVSVFGNNPHWK